MTRSVQKYPIILFYRHWWSREITNTKVYFVLNTMKFWTKKSQIQYIVTLSIWILQRTAPDLQTNCMHAMEFPVSGLFLVGTFSRNIWVMLLTEYFREGKLKVLQTKPKNILFLLTIFIKYCSPHDPLILKWKWLTIKVL